MDHRSVGPVSEFPPDAVDGRGAHARPARHRPDAPVSRALGGRTHREGLEAVPVLPGVPGPRSRAVLARLRAADHPRIACSTDVAARVRRLRRMGMSIDSRMLRIQDGVTLNAGGSSAATTSISSPRTASASRR